MADNETAKAPRRPRPTLAQQIAHREAELQKLKAQQQQQSRKLATREKIILGGAIIAATRNNAELRRIVSGIVREHVTKDIDREVVAAWLSLT